ncbi:MAG: Putative cytoplasmic protein clustered with trehalase, partial [uncultured Rubrobacteraceae bacterium]
RGPGGAGLRPPGERRARRGGCLRWAAVRRYHFALAVRPGRVGPGAGAGAFRVRVQDRGVHPGRAAPVRLLLAPDPAPRHAGRQARREGPPQGRHLRGQGAAPGAGHGGRRPPRWGTRRGAAGLRRLARNSRGRGPPLRPPGLGRAATGRGRGRRQNSDQRCALRGQRAL